MQTAYESETIKIVECVDDDGDIQRQLFLGPPFRNVQGTIKTKRPKYHVQEFTRNLTYGALCAQGGVKNALFLGLGAGVVIQAVRDLFPLAHCDVVDLSPELIEISHDFFFEIYSDSVSLFPEDAFDYVKKTGKQYDYVCCDIWAHSLEIPSCLIDGEFLDCVNGMVSANGVLALNTQRFLHKQMSEALARRFKLVLSLQGFNCLLLATRGRPRWITDQKIVDDMLSINIDIKAIQDNLMLIRSARNDDLS